MTIVESNRSSEEQFDLFCTADGFEGVLNHFNRLCGQLSINNTPNKHPWNIYKELRTQLRSYWKAAALFEKLDKRVQCSQYLHQTICNGVNAVVVGCGPCGLRCAIELALLGARVVVLEKRTTFSRNNVLHLWPYLIEDLRALGAKTFFGKFCAGSIDHISIRTMQCILLKTALLFGVQVFPGVTYQDLLQPTSDPSVESNMTTSITRVFIEQTGLDTVGSPLTVVNGQCVNGIHSPNGTHHVTLSKRKPAEIGVHGKVPNKTNSVGSDVPLTIGWRMQLTPEIAVLKNYEIDVLIGADGKRSCLEFPSKELRCRLAIAITANFVNYHTQAEAEVEEISGVASIFNQQFFARLASDTGVDLENIVYYKDETHYFVMTAKKHSLLAKGVLKQDREDSQSLLNADNIDHLALQAYARETANYVTNGRLPRLDFALNSHGQPDVDAFDFTRMFAAEYSCRIQEQKQHLLMQCLVGDGLFEPFWPTGSGCALGFLSAMDAAWAVSRLSCGLAPLQVIAQRESVYQRLSQTTAQNMPSNFVDYTLDPRTRYTRCNLNLFHAHQVRHLYITDRDKTSRSKSVQGSKKDVFDTVNGFTSNFLKETILSARTRYTTCTTPAPSDLGLLRWFQFRLSFYAVCGILDMPIDLSAAVWDAGIHLQCLIHLYRPELIPELDHLIQQGRDVDLCALFRRRTSSGMQPQPNLIRACGILMEHFDVMFKAKHDPSATTYPKQNTDWAAYLTQVYQALRNLKFVEPKLTAATSRRESTRSAHPELSNGHNPKHKVLNRQPVAHARSAHKHGGNRNNSYVIEQRDLAKGKAHMTTFGKRAFREDPNRAVEKGLLSKRRTELIATLDNRCICARDLRNLCHWFKLMCRQSPVSIKRRTPAVQQSVISTQSPPLPVSPIVSSTKKHSPVPIVYSNQSNSPRAWSSTRSEARLFANHNPLTRSQSTHGANPSAIRITESFEVCSGYRTAATTLVLNLTVHFLFADKFYCLAHSPNSITGSTTVSKQPCGGSSGVSLVDRLRAGQFPFRNPGNQSVSFSQTHTGLVTSTQYSDQPITRLPSKLNQPPTAPGSYKSALLTGLQDEGETVMGVAGVRAAVRSCRLAPPGSSSPSPVRKPAPKANPHLPLVRDPSAHLGIRDDHAPGPNCYLAGHLGLPEVERRANWDLNTMVPIQDTSIPDLLEHMRSSESGTSQTDEHHEDILLDKFKYARSKRFRDRKPHTNLSKSAPGKKNEPSTTESVEDDSSSSISSAVNRFHGSSSKFLSPIHNTKLEAKKRFCMEPPKPLTIDPKQFIGSKNRERTITHTLLDCSEHLTAIHDTDVCHAYVASVSCYLECPPTSLCCESVDDSFQTSTSSYAPTAMPRRMRSVDRLSSSSRCSTVTTDANIVHPALSSGVLLPSYSAPFALLDEFRDIDSTSTLTERSSCERAPRLEENQQIVRSPLRSERPNPQIVTDYASAVSLRSCFLFADREYDNLCYTDSEQRGDSLLNSGHIRTPSIANQAQQGASCQDLVENNQPRHENTEVALSYPSLTGSVVCQHSLQPIPLTLLDKELCDLQNRVLRLDDPTTYKRHHTVTCFRLDTPRSLIPSSSGPGTGHFVLKKRRSNTVNVYFPPHHPGVSPNQRIVSDSSLGVARRQCPLSETIITTRTVQSVPLRCTSNPDRWAKASPRNPECERNMILPLPRSYSEPIGLDRTTQFVSNFFDISTTG
ncbi:F-actin monooxygenase [Paragonimus westermani]|uniref:F-actin monooxygenase n=1 Tax=Paragonimus westermani TaxID=34504 RepID=A0A5J4NMR3_9TREM|nr:F-actin monooxygenase [Paragonimus westermani]